MSACKSIKDKVAIGTAVASFVLGWTLTAIGFWCEPLGEVADSCLWILSQSLLYCGSVVGVSAYFNSEAKRMRADIRTFATRLSRGEQPDEPNEEIEDE